MFELYAIFNPYGTYFYRIYEYNDQDDKKKIVTDLISHQDVTGYVCTCNKEDLETTLRNLRGF